MPLHLDQDVTDEISLEDIKDQLRKEKIDTSSQQDFPRAAPMLKRLANNKTFLADLALEELKRGYSGPTTVYHYSAQVMLLHLPRGQEDNFYLRANFWPSEQDQPVRAAGTGPFFYHRPHDHNFNFLTVGYFGPGYWSNYYEYDHDQIDGYPDEPVPSLKFIEKRNLAEGDLMLYRASKDVHEQLPADSMSISLNILENTSRARLTNQYSFDLERAAIKQIINISLAPCVFGVTAMLGGENGEDILTEISKNSPDPFTRFSAYKALAGTFADSQQYQQKMSAALKDKSPMVTNWAQNHIAAISNIPG